MIRGKLRIDGYEGISVEIDGSQITIFLLKRGLFYFPKTKTFSTDRVLSVETSPPTKNFGGFIKINTNDTFRRSYLSGVIAGAQDRYDQNIIQFASDQEFATAEEIKALLLR